MSMKRIFLTMLLQNEVLKSLNSLTKRIYIQERPELNLLFFNLLLECLLNSYLCPCSCFKTEFVHGIKIIIKVDINSTKNNICRKIAYKYLREKDRERDENSIFFYHACEHSHLDIVKILNYLLYWFQLWWGLFLMYTLLCYHSCK